ncbi:hypothetical protein JP39_05690 [Companilactobacillus heilongjiangensis]|uniref:Antitoxin n=1 Tax=Companilactobacillus heilongjiangensis TaxID=1074467 RepID=A0A0K2LCI5_9LACO|nr:hypothetical protein JP39_05690 [Companilactobacillus heilongjiangensis]
MLGVITLEKVTNLAHARENLNDIIKSVNNNSTPIEIIGPTPDESAVIMSLKDYRSFKETLYLLNDGTLNKVHQNMTDNAKEMDITGGIDWDKIN